MKRSYAHGYHTLEEIILPSGCKARVLVWHDV
jgi:hypothetical protein